MRACRSANSAADRSAAGREAALKEPAGQHQRHRLAVRNAVALGLCIAIVDLGVMFVLPLLAIEPRWVRALADAGIVTALLVPAVYALVLRPMRQRIAELVEREAALRESQERTRSITMAATDAIISADAQGRIVLWNAAAERVFGYSSAEALGQPLTLIMPDGFRKAHQEGMARVAATGEFHLAGKVVEMVGRRKDGREFPLELSVTVYPSEEETRFTSIVRDVSERKLQEAALARSEERLRTLVQAAPDAIFIQARGCFAYLNPAAVRLFGAADSAELLRRPVVERLHPDYRALVNKRIRQTNEHHEAASVVVEKYLRCDGGEVDVEVSAVPFVFEGESGALVFARDITARRRAEAELAKAMDFSFSLLRQAPALIWRSGTDAKCDWFNATWLEFTGRTMEQERGDGWAEGVHPEDLQRCVKTYLEAFKARQPFEMEYRLRRHDGQYRWIIDRGIPFNALSGDFGGYIGYCFDITERRDAEVALGQANRAKDEFLARLSHELRTPLTPVVLSVAQWQGRNDLPAALSQDLAMMRRNLELEARLLEDLLDINRIVHGKLPLRRETTDLHTKITHALAILNADIQAKRIEVQDDLRAECSWMDGDAARIQQVFWNLLSHALKFTPEGGRITISSANEPEGRIRVQISDSGRGIQPELLPRLFQPFEQGGHATTSQYGGLGLGLAICRSVVALHGGSITAHSEGLGHGTTFTIHLPTVAGPAAEATPASVSPGQVNGHRRRVLLVEDHPDTARIMARLLKSWGHTVRIAHSVAEALKVAEEPFDLLVSDLGLPDGNGHDLMRQLSRRCTPEYGFRAIAVSGFGMEEDQQRSREVGFVTHLTKPVSPAALKVAIAEAFRDAESQHQIQEPVSVG